MIFNYSRFRFSHAAFIALAIAETVYTILNHGMSTWMGIAWVASWLMFAIVSVDEKEKKEAWKALYEAEKKKLKTP